MRFKGEYQKKIREYGVPEFCRENGIGIRSMYYLFMGKRKGKPAKFSYEVLRKVSGALNVSTDDLFE